MRRKPFYPPPSNPDIHTEAHCPSIGDLSNMTPFWGIGPGPNGQSNSYTHLFFADTEICLSISYNT